MNFALSPLDGRDRKSVDELRKILSEEGLNFHRTEIEIEWFLFLADEKFFELNSVDRKFLREILEKFWNENFAEEIKQIEKITNHDVKAVEVFLRKKFAERADLKNLQEWLHFGLTSEDVNNLCWARMIRSALTGNLIPAFEKILAELSGFTRKWKAVPMLARTHGQPASPTTVGKEFLIFARRVDRQIQFLKSQEFLGKFSGATGNFSAVQIAFPDKNWISLSKKFVEKLKLKFNPVCPQIEPHDFLAEISHSLFRVNSIFIDFCRDTWEYISRDFFGQKKVENETGSSTMPHKINPIDFENAEGNFGVARALFSHFAEKLPISRMQRDLSDSTVMRNFSVAFGHTFLATKKLQKGLKKLELRAEVLAADLNSHPEILTEAVQTVLRKFGAENPYEKLKQFSRGEKLNLPKLREFIAATDLPADEKEKLLNLTPEKYVGLAEQLCEKFAV